jgi:sodium-dependent phosphate cotransporter
VHLKNWEPDVTSIIQSSSATTSIVVGLAAAGVLGGDMESSLRATVPIMMGANIGTTVTNILVSFGHIGDNREFQRAFGVATVHDFFNLLTVCILLPLEILTNILSKIALYVTTLFAGVGGLKLANPFKAIISPQVDLIKTILSYQGIIDFIVFLVAVLGILSAIGWLESRRRKNINSKVQAFIVIILISIIAVFFKHYHTLIFVQPVAIFLTGLCLLFVALYFLVNVMRTLVLARLEILFHNYIFKTTLRAFTLGIILTMLVQSSSVTTSIIVPLAGAGILNIVQVYPYTLGTNIGTTITAGLAALSLGVDTGIAAALSHLLINILGVSIWLPLKRVPIFIANKFAGIAAKSQVLPIFYIFTAFFIIPIMLIYLFK